MINNAVNGTLDIDGTTMDYISFGKGKRNLVVILGLQDGMKTVKGSAVQLSMMFPKFGKSSGSTLSVRKTGCLKALRHAIWRKMSIVR